MLPELFGNRGSECKGFGAQFRHRYIAQQRIIAHYQAYSHIRYLEWACKSRDNEALRDGLHFSSQVPPVTSGRPLT